MIHRRSVVLPLLAALAATPSPAQTRHGNVTCRPPGAYKVETTTDGVLRLRLDDDKDYLELRILPGAALAGSVEDHVDRFLAAVQQNNPTDYEVTIARASMQPRNATRLSTAGASARHPDDHSRYSYFLVWCYEANGRVETIVLNTNSTALYGKQQRTIDRFLNGLRFDSARILADGKPPLTAFAYDRTVGFVEWLLEVPMTGEQRASIRDAMLAAWRDDDRETIDATTELVNGVDALAGKSEDEKRALRVILRTQALEEWRKSEDAVERMLAGVYDAANKPLVAGDPPLTQQVCDAMADAFYVMACAVAGTAMQTPDADLLAKWRDLVVAQYPNMPADARKALQQMPVFAAAMRAGWSEIPATERDALVAQWKDVPGIEDLGRQLAATAMRARLSAQAQLQASALRFQVMSNILRMQHETSMTIIHNMSGSGWRYEYRY